MYAWSVHHKNETTNTILNISYTRGIMFIRVFLFQHNKKEPILHWQINLNPSVLPTAFRSLIYYHSRVFKISSISFGYTIGMKRIALKGFIPTILRSFKDLSLPSRTPGYLLEFEIQFGHNDRCFDIITKVCTVYFFRINAFK